MAEPWSGQSLQALPTTVLGALGTLGSEFLREWEVQDMRVTLFKLLLLWLVLSLLGIQLAWGFYGSTVTGLYHRPGKQQQTNLSKPTENKGRQQRDLQRHHRVCWFPHWVLLLPRPQRLHEGRGWGQGVPQCLQTWPSIALGLASSSSRHWASKICLYPDLGALRRENMFLLSQGSAKEEPMGWGGQQSIFCLGFFLSPFPSPGM